VRLLVTRPQPGADATAKQLLAGGHDVVVLPLMTTEAVAWRQPRQRPQAVMVTSAAALRHGGNGLAALVHLPLYAVGAATAQAARRAGFADVRAGSGTVQTLADAIAADGLARVLHLAGEDVTPLKRPAGLAIFRRTVYRAPLVSLATLPVVDWVLLYSPRTAAHFAAEIDRLGGNRADIGIAAISVAALGAAGAGWRRAVAAAQPSEAALLAAIGATCDKPLASQGS
jgi:uroporphyrinogen-III synthase